MSILVQRKYLVKGTETLTLFSSKEMGIHKTTVAKVRIMNPFKVLNNCILYTPEKISSGIGEDSVSTKTKLSSFLVCTFVE